MKKYSIPETNGLRKDSFKEIPPQIEWIFPILIAFATCITFTKSGWLLWVSIVSYVIILNGWISSKASEYVYSDKLLTIDIITCSIYLCMLLALYYSQDTLKHEYWLYSSLLCILYSLWDFFITPTKEYIKRYAILMIVCSVLFLLLYLGEIWDYFSSHISISIGTFIWSGTLLKWYYDKSYKNNF